MKLTLVHDFLNQDGGAEHVLRVLQELYPEAPTFALLHDAKRVQGFDTKKIRESFLAQIPFSTRAHQWLLPLIPAAVEQHALPASDIVLSNSSAFCHGVIPPLGSTHICYCHTPPRFLWSDCQSYVEEVRAPALFKKLLPPLLAALRLWDYTAAQKVHAYIANSKNVQRRIHHYYGRESVVIHPPVDTKKFHVGTSSEKYFLTGGRLVSYKHFEIAVDACTRTRLPLIIFGTGPAEAALKARAGSSVRFVGRVSDTERARLYAGARAFLHPQEEDFGITAVESMASGRPVIAYAKGGALETVDPNCSGEFFEEQSWEELADHLIRFGDHHFDPLRIRAHAETFDRSVFQKKIQELLSSYAPRN